MSSSKWRLFCLGLNELTASSGNHSGRIWSIPWLPKPGFLVSLGHRQLCHWLSWITSLFLPQRKDFNYLWHRREMVEYTNPLSFFLKTIQQVEGWIYGPDCLTPDNIRCLLGMTAYWINCLFWVGLLISWRKCTIDLCSSQMKLFQERVS